MQAISNAGSAIGILAKDGVVLAAEKKIMSKVSTHATILQRPWPPSVLHSKISDKKIHSNVVFIELSQ